MQNVAVLIVLCMLFYHVSPILATIEASTATKDSIVEIDIPRDRISRHLHALLSIGAEKTKQHNVGGANAAGAAALGGLTSMFPRQGLNETCNNNLCNMFESALSCKALGFHISKICAQYLLGFIFGCSDYPSPGELFMAPSSCLGELTSLLPPKTVPAPAADAVEGTAITTYGEDDGEEAYDEEGEPLGGALDLSNLKFTHVREYLASDFSVNCKRRCFQRYIEQADTFYNSCSDELLKFVNHTDNKNLVYPLPYITETYQDFRNQVCTHNKNGTNCFSEVQQFLPNPDKEAPAVNIFQYDCNYINDTFWNGFVMDQVCDNFKNAGCCFGNQVAMLALSQTNTSAGPPKNNHKALHMFQPCLMRYLVNKCNHTDPYNFCTEGANANVSTIRGSVVMGANRGFRDTVKLVNIYDADKVVEFSGVLSFGIFWDNDSPTKQGALGVEILNFAYFNSTIEEQSDSTQLTPLDGSLYSTPFQGDFTKAKSARYDFQFVLQGKTQKESDDILTVLTDKQGCSSAGSLMPFLYTNPTCVNITQEAKVFVANPIIATAKSGVARATVFGFLLPLLLTAFTIVLI
jgi:hypothetical protein